MAPDSLNTSGGEIAVNGRRYRLPKEPVVVVCVDGSEPGYIERAVEATTLPVLLRTFDIVGYGRKGEAIIDVTPHFVSEPPRGFAFGFMKPKENCTSPFRHSS